MRNKRKVIHLPKEIAKRFINKDIEFSREYVKNNKNDPHALNAVDHNGNTPLILAASEGHIQIVELLLANPHVNVNAVNHNRETALTVAVIMAWSQLAKVLLKHKDIDVNYIRYALHFAVEQEDSEFIEYLLRDKSIRDNNGKTAEDYDEYHIITPAAPSKPKPKTYAVNADEYQQFMMWKKEKRSANREERHLTNVNTMRL